MAHLIDQSTGKAAFISYQMPAWHGLGKTFDREITIIDALTESGCAYHVSKHPNIHRLPNGKDIFSQESFFTMRDDTSAVLGSRLGKNYTIFQNTQAFDIVAEMLNTGRCKIETIGAIDGGKKVFVCLKLNDKISVSGKDPVEQYVLLANAHDGTMSQISMPTAVRVVCNNTLSMALYGAKAEHKIRHTTNIAARVKEAFTIMGLLDDSRKQSSYAYNAMKETVISKQEFFDYLGNIFLTQEEIKEVQKGNKEAISTRKRNIITDVIDFANNGVGQDLALDGQMNMWWAYNAVTGHATAKKYADADARFDSMIMGSSQRLIKSAADLALNPKDMQPVRHLISAVNAN